MDKRITEIEKEVLSILKNRWKKGRKTYGVGLLSSQQDDMLGWLNNAIEEAADMLQYLVAMKVQFKIESIKHDEYKR